MTLKQSIRRYGLLAAGVLVVAALHVVRMSDDSRTAVCWLRRTFDVPCPTCGMTRAFAALAKGELQQAYAYNPLSPLYAAVALACWAYASWCLACGRPFPTFGGRRAIIACAALGALALVVWIVRVIVPLAHHSGGT